MDYEVTTICGSMRYYPQMLKAAEELTRLRYIVLMPFISSYVGGTPADDTKLMLDDMHKRKIDMSQSIHVIGSHIGESTKSEIEYAQSHNLRVYYIS